MAWDSMDSIAPCVKRGMARAGMDHVLRSREVGDNQGP